MTDSCPRPLSQKPRAVAIGAFDGVHLGHAAVVRSVVEAAEHLGICAAALTFEPTPRQYFARSDDARKRLTLNGERVELLCRLGIEQTLVQTFDEELRQMSPREFADSILRDKLDARYVSVGASHSFGAGRSGGPDEIVRLGQELGFEVHIVPLVSIEGRPVSSTEIRKALAARDLSAAGRMLGRPYSVSGTVVEGHGRGAEMGFPTANIIPPPDKVLPPDGVYAALAVVGDGPAAPCPAAVSLGPAPTLDVDERRLEAHLIDFRGHAYGHRMTVGFLRHLRPIHHFGHVAQLMAQVREDIAAARRACAEYGILAPDLP